MTAAAERLAERLWQVAESQRMDFAQPDVAAMLDDAAEALDGLGALSAERDAEKKRADKAEAGRALLQETAERIVAEREALRARIEAAPHDVWVCLSVDEAANATGRPCTCWKSAALAGDQPEATPDDAPPFTPSTEDVLVAWTHGFHGDNHNDQRVQYTEAEFWRWLTGELNRAREGQS